MNQSFSHPHAIELPNFPAHDVSAAEEQALIWQQVLTHSINGLVGLTAVRDETGQIIDFRYKFINQVALRDTFRIRPAESHDITGKLLTEFFPSIHKTSLWSTYVSVVETGQPSRIEQHYNVDNRDVWVIQSASSFGSDSLLLSYAETSDLHLAARRVARQSALLNGVLNSSPNGIIVYEAVRDPNDKLLDFQTVLVNQMFETLTRRESPYFMERSLSAIYRFGPNRMERLRQLIDTGEPVHFDEFIPALNRWLDITLTRLNDGFVATVKDITADKQIRQQLEDTVRDLHRSNQNLEQFAYVASHDLQEPLRKIVSFGDVLANQFTDEMSESAGDLVRRMQRSAERMRSLVQDLLTYARLSGNAETFKAVDLNHLIASVADDLEMTIIDQQVTLQFDPLPTVWGDPTLLRQLFQNLLSNAMKFHRPGRNKAATKPHVRVQGYLASYDELSHAIGMSDLPPSNRQYAIVDIVDNGIGFDERYLDRIFTIFQRLHGQMHFPGTGVGLAICRKVVDLHNGHITAISREGEGATFRVFLPVQ
jgi:signal transduction histidine kinase